MAKAKKLPSGNWRVQVFDYKDENGKNHYRSYTAPTKAEAEYMAAYFKKTRPPKEDNEPEVTVGQAIDKYIDLSATLSPTTIARYRNMRKFAFPDLMNMNLSDLDDRAAQIEINKEIKRPNGQTGNPLSAKTIRNEWALVSAALKSLYNMTLNVKLPKVQRAPKELPDPQLVIDAIKGTDIELPCLLSIWLSFSLSEIRGFKCSSIRNGQIYVDQVLVTVDGFQQEKKDAKVETRKRSQSVPKYIMKLIEMQPNYKEYKKTGKDSYLVPMTQNLLYHRYKKILEPLGIDISFHDLRHMFASVMLNKLQIPEKVVQEEGGWSTPSIMKSVYSNTFSDSRKSADSKRDEFFESLL